MKAWAHILDWLYPPSCALCEAPLSGGVHLCAPCRASLPPLPPVHCRTCAHPFDGAITNPERCHSCEAIKPAFDFATSALVSNEESINLIHQFKLLKRPELAPDLARIAASSFPNHPRLAAFRNPLLVPVPLHPRRLRERGFNQAAELSSHLSRLLDISTQSVLRRVVNTPRQATLSRKQRLRNLRKAFQLRTPRGDDLSAFDLVLIDDVFTTGSTVHECARILRTARPRSIAVFTIVRA
ncbi:MAG: ComF family protein [Verrucomicrobiota bacterium JB023]|nr:ComF family protein [Verrucomicrobiota bacterium JB023]